MPKISIVMPIHADNEDKARWFGEAYQSLNVQTLTDWELILVDDCSPLSFDVPRDERIRHVKTGQNNGPATCRNTAVAMARSEAIIALDADDLLAYNTTLESMYNAWDLDHSRVVYGDLQRLEKSKKGKVFNLPEYSFERSLNLNGIMPVTALHSVECHQKAGGWKPFLDAGLEDIEYWIAAGKAGFCGLRIHEIVLLYRRHEQSRSYKLRSVNRRETEMRNKIKQLHSDVFEGRYPMSCCGGGRSTTPKVQAASQGSNPPATLDQYPAEEKTWVQYNGKQGASFGVMGQGTGITYQIRGPQHQLEVHDSDLGKFRRAGRGKDFSIGIAPPQGASQNNVPQVEDTIFEGEPPVLAELVTLDSVALGKEPTIEPVQINESEILSSREIREELDKVSQQRPSLIDIEPAPEFNIEPAPENRDLTPLNLTKSIQDMLELESWSIQGLADASSAELIRYPGIGPKVAKKIITNAKKAIGA